MKTNKYILQGEWETFELEVSDYGFVLWKDNQWILDASTLCEDGTLSIGTNHQALKVSMKKKYKFYPHHEFQIVRRTKNK